MTAIYDRIKARREELGMSQEELAFALGYKSRSTIAKIEAGLNDIPQSRVAAFATALNTTIAYLMGWSNEDIVSNSLPLVKNSTEGEVSEVYMRLAKVAEQKKNQTGSVRTNNKCSRRI